MDNEQLLSGLLRQLITIRDQKQIEEQQKEIRTIQRRNFIRTVILTIAVIIFIIVCTFSIYQRYAAAITTIYDMPAPIDENQEVIPADLPIDPNQQDITEKSVQVEEEGTPHENTPDSQNEETTPRSDGHFTIYSNGDVYHAETGNGSLTCDVRNVEDSTHDIIMSIYLTREEMQAHGISTEDMEEDGTGR